MIQNQMVEHDVKRQCAAAVVEKYQEVKKENLLKKRNPHHNYRKN